MLEVEQMYERTAQFWSIVLGVGSIAAVLAWIICKVTEETALESAAC
jgi:hypothetical protein